MPSTGLQTKIKLSKIKPEIVEMIKGFDCTGDDLAAKSRELTLLLLQESEYPFSRRQFASRLVFRDRLRTASLLHLGDPFA